MDKMPLFDLPEEEGFASEYAPGGKDATADV
jgi:hypothetical protein